MTTRAQSTARRLQPVVWFLVLVTTLEALLALAAVAAAVRPSLVSSGVVTLLEVLTVLWLPVVLAALALAVRTLRRLAAEADTATEHLSSAVASTRDWFWCVDPAGRVTYSSVTSRTVCGWEPADLIGRRLLDVIAEGNRDQAVSGFERHVAERTGWEDELARLTTADGESVIVEHSAAPAFDRDGRLVGFGGACRPARPELLDQHRHLKARSTVQEILDLGGFRPAFQPIVGLLDGAIVGVEALMRFDPAPYEPPDVWFARAHACGLGVALEAAAVARVLRILRLLPPTVPVSINATPAFAVSPELTALLGQGLPGQGPGHGAAPLSRLVLELSEHDAIEDYERLTAVLSPLRESGLGVAVDNAGPAYATSDHIAHLRPDLIKIDGTSVTAVDRDAGKAAVVAAVVRLGQEVSADVTAEGVETAEELAALTRLGVQAAQGFHLARPTASPAVWRTWAAWG